MRIVFNVALVISLLYLPWFIGAIVAIAGCFIIGRFYEVIAYGILFDALYGSNFGFYGFTYIATLYTFIVCIIVSTVRRKLAW